MTPTYEDFWTAVQNDIGRDIGTSWRQVPQLLRQISDETLRDSGLALTALVVTDNEGGGPSEGFFTLSVREGLLEEAEAPRRGEPWVGMSNRQNEFWIEHVAQIFDAFGHESN